MAQTTYQSISREIAALQAQAEAIKKKETAEVIARIKEAIAQYDLSAKDLGFGGGRGAVKKSPKSSRSTAAGGYTDGQGNTWSGRGRRPQWFLDAIAAGKAPEELQVGAGAPKTRANGKSNGPAASKRAKSKQVGYTDGTNTWSGRGRRPQWFLDALAGGKTVEEMRA